MKDIIQQIKQAKANKKNLEDKLKIGIYRIAQLKEELESVFKAQIFFQQVAKDIQNSAKLQIEGIVQSLLDICFPDQFTFDFSFEASRGKTVIDISVIEQGEKIHPFFAGGGANGGICTTVRHGLPVRVAGRTSRGARCATNG